MKGVIFLLKPKNRPAGPPTEIYRSKPKAEDSGRKEVPSGNRPSRLTPAEIKEALRCSRMFAFVGSPRRGHW